MAKCLLLNLPFVPSKRIITLMHPMEIVMLSMCSSRMRLLLRNVKYKIMKCTVELYNKFSVINLHWGDGNETKLIFTGGHKEYGQLLFVRGFEADGKQFRFWAKNSIDDAIFTANRIRFVFSIEYFKWKLWWSHYRVKSLKNRLSSMIHGKYEMVDLEGDRIDFESLNYLMEHLNFKSEFKLFCSLPLNFQHKNALKFKSLLYTEARWIGSIDQLFSIRNRGYVYLENTIFDCNDINRFLRFWIDTDEDMMRYLRVFLNKRSPIDFNALKNQIITLDNIIVQEGVLESFFILARNKKRKYILGCVVASKEEGIQIETWSREDEEYIDKISAMEMLYQKDEMGKSKENGGN